MDGKRHGNDATPSGMSRLRAVAAFVLLLLFAVQTSPAVSGPWTRGVHASSPDQASQTVLIEAADAENDFGQPDQTHSGAVLPAPVQIEVSAATFRPVALYRNPVRAAPPIGLPFGRAPPRSSQI